MLSFSFRLERHSDPPESFGISLEAKTKALALSRAFVIVGIDADDMKGWKVVQCTSKPIEAKEPKTAKKSAKPKRPENGEFEW